MILLVLCTDDERSHEQKDACRTKCAVRVLQGREAVVGIDSGEA